MKSLVNKLKANGLKIATAESCTGGLVAKTITNYSGASEVFEYGFTTYSNEAKVKILGVNPETIEQFGAVSEQTAAEMANGARNVSGADIAVSVTGVAGPNASEGKAVGTVCIGVATGEKAYANTFLFAGSRAEIRKQSAKMACKLALAELGGLPTGEKLTKRAVKTVKSIKNKITKKQKNT